jgi:hypothetical protein
MGFGADVCKIISDERSSLSAQEGVAAQGEKDKGSWKEENATSANSATTVGRFEADLGGHVRILAEKFAVLGLKFERQMMLSRMLIVL